MVEAIYKKPFVLAYPDPLPRIKTAVYRDLIILFMKIAEKFKNSIPKLIKVLQASVLPPVDLEVTGTLGEIFWDAPFQGPAYAIAVGIDNANAPRALDLLCKLAREDSAPYPASVPCGLVKQSKAAMAFTRFPVIRVCWRLMD